MFRSLFSALGVLHSSSSSSSSLPCLRRACSPCFGRCSQRWVCCTPHPPPLLHSHAYAEHARHVSVAVLSAGCAALLILLLFFTPMLTQSMLAMFRSLFSALGVLHSSSSSSSSLP